MVPCSILQRAVSICIIKSDFSVYGSSIPIKCLFFHVGSLASNNRCISLECITSLFTVYSIDDESIMEFLVVKVSEWETEPPQWANKRMACWWVWMDVKMFDVFDLCMVCRSCGHGSFEYILLSMYVIPKNVFSPLAYSVIVLIDGCQSCGTHDMSMTKGIYFYGFDVYWIQCVRFPRVFSIWGTFSGFPGTFSYGIPELRHNPFPCDHSSHVPVFSHREVCNVRSRHS